MPRNKNAKRTNKSQSMSNILVSVQKMEKELMQTPSDIAAHLSKEINAHKQQESKLKIALNKIKATIKAAEARLKAVKAKNTASSKKQMKVAKKAYSEAVKTQNALNKQLQALSKTIDALLSKHARLIAMGKALSQFSKEWSKSEKLAKANAKSKTNAKVKTKTKVKAKKVKTKSKAKAHSASIQELHSQSDDSSVDNASFDEPTELVA